MQTTLLNAEELAGSTNYTIQYLLLDIDNAALTTYATVARYDAKVFGLMSYSIEHTSIFSEQSTGNAVMQLAESKGSRSLVDLVTVAECYRIKDQARVISYLVENPQLVSSLIEAFDVIVHRIGEFEVELELETAPDENTVQLVGSMKTNLDAESALERFQLFVNEYWSRIPAYVATKIGFNVVV